MATKVIFYALVEQSNSLADDSSSKRRLPHLLTMLYGTHLGPPVVQGVSMLNRLS